MSEDLIVRKTNTLVYAIGENKYNTNELKFISLQIASVDTINAENFEDDIKVNVKDLGFDVRPLSKSNEYATNKSIKQFCKTLYKKPFYLPDDPETLIGWFSSIKYQDGVITYTMSKKLRPFLLQLQGNYTQYFLKNILKLNSSYAIHIYEFLKEVFPENYKNIPLDVFRKTLNIPKSYANADVKRVITKAQKEIGVNTDLNFTFKFKKMGKAFDSIDFNFNKKKQVLFED